MWLRRFEVAAKFRGNRDDELLYCPGGSLDAEERIGRADDSVVLEVSVARKSLLSDDEGLEVYQMRKDLLPFAISEIEKILERLQMARYVR